MIETDNDVGRFVRVDWDAVERVGIENVGPVIPDPKELLRVERIGGTISSIGCPWVLVELVSYTKLYVWLPGDILVPNVYKEREGTNEDSCC